MNHFYRVIYNRVLGCWQAVSELAKSSGKLGGAIKRHAAKLAALSTVAAIGGLGSGVTQAQNAPAVNQLPQGGNVAAGSAQINQSGNVMNIDQATQKAIINWNEFNVGQDARVNFNQPGADSATLNRVLSNDPSQIFGQIVAPGQVILINPNGAYFAPSASVDVGGLIATTHELADKDFLAGNYQFKRNGAKGKIINEGELKARLDGYIALMAPEVRNQGVIVAERGTVVIAAGEHIQLNFGTGNKLQGITVTEQDLDAQIENKHAIFAEGGLVILSARATAELRASVIKNSGQIVASAGANTVTMKGGRIILEGDTIAVQEGSQLIATGPKGGGEILVGGDWQGGANEARRVFDNPDKIHQATTVTVEKNTTLNVSATDNGNGGTVVVWSDVKNPKSVTTVQGQILAKGGESGGDGGQIETSGARLITDGVSGSAAAQNVAAGGKAGEWLFDPTNVTIGTTGTALSNNDGTFISASSIAGLLAGGTNVTVTTFSSGIEIGDLTVASSIVKSSGDAHVTLSLRAANSIIISQDITNTGGSGALNLILDADNNTASSTGAPVRDGAGTVILEANLSTAGGDVTFGGTAVNGYNGGNLYVGGGSTAILVATGGGDFTVNGQLMVANSSTEGFTVSTAGGDIHLGGAVDSGNVFTGVGGDRNWEAAFDHAADQPGDTWLATIDSSLENDLAKLAAGNERSWLGGRRKIDTNLWQWVADPDYDASTNPLTFFYQGTTTQTELDGLASGEGGTTSDGYYANWAGWTNGQLVGEPNNRLGRCSCPFSGDHESALEIIGSIGKWNDTNGINTNNRRRYILKQNLAPSRLTLDAGAGAVILNGSVGSLKEISSLNITAGSLVAGTIKTSSSLTVNISGPSTVSAVISGAGSLTKSGSGALTLSGTNTYTGNTTVLAGTLKLGANNALSDNTALVVSGGTFDLGGFADTVASVQLTSGLISNGTLTSITDFDVQAGSVSSAVLAGSVGLNKTTTGSVTLSGANTYTGTTTISAGTLQVGAGSTTGTLGSGAVVNNAALIFNRSNDLTQSGVISGAGGVTQLGSGTLTLTANGTYTGATTISAGVLVLANNSPTTASSGFSGAGSLRIESIDASFDNAFGYNSSILVLDATLGGLTIGKAGNSANVSLDSALNVAGPVTLFGGNVAVNASVDTRAAAAGGVEVIASNGIEIAAAIQSQSRVTLGGTVTLANDVIFTGSTIHFKNTVVGNQALTVTGNAEFDSSVGAGVGTALTSLTVTGTTTLASHVTTTGAQTYTGATTLTGVSIVTGSDLTLGSVALGSHALIVSASASGTASITGVISGTGGIDQIGAGRLNLLGDNTYSGVTLLKNGNASSVLGLGHKNALGMGELRIDSVGHIEALVDLSGANKVLNDVILSGKSSHLTAVGSNNLELGGGFTLGGNRTQNNITNNITGDGVLTLSGSITGSVVAKTLDIVGNGSTIISGVIQNGSDTLTLALTKHSSGTLTLSGANTYTGNTTVLAGTLKIGANNVLSDVTAVVVSGGNFDLGGFAETVSGVQLISGSITNGTLASTSNFDVRAGSVSAVLAGSVGLNKTTAGSVTLSGANTYTGTTTISAGTLQVGAGSTTGTLSSGAVVNNAALSFNRSNDLTQSGIVSGTGKVTQSGTGTLTLTGNNTYTGTTLISQGTLQVGNGTATGVLGAGAIINNAALDFNRSDDFTFANLITGTGSLTQLGSGTLTLSGANTYTGSTTISAGTLALGANNVLSDSTAVVVSGGTFDLGGFADTVASVQLTSGLISNGTLISTTNFDVQAGSVIAVLAGSVGLNKTTAGTVTLSGANTYSGDTNVQAGVLQAGVSSTESPSFTDGAFGVGLVTVNGGAGLDLNGFTVTNNLTLTGTGYNTGSSLTGALFNAAAGSATVNGNIELADDVTVRNLGALVINGTINQASGATTSALTLTNTGLVTLSGIIGESTAIAGLQIDSNSMVDANVTTAGTQTFGGAVTLGRNVMLRTTDSAVAFQGTLNADDSETNNLTINTGSGAVTFASFIGTATDGELGVLAVNSIGKTWFKGAVTAATVTTDVGGTIQIDGGSISTTGAQSYGEAMTLGANTTFNVTSLSAAAIDMAGFDLTVNESGTGLISGTLSGTDSALVKQGAGTVMLSDANTYTGGTTVSAGILKAGISSVGAPGSITSGAFGTGNVTIANNAALDVAGQTVANTIAVQGEGFDESGTRTGAIFNTAATLATISGAVTLGGNTLIRNNGALTITGTIDAASAGSASSLIIGNTSMGMVLITLTGDIGSGQAITSLTVEDDLNLAASVITSGNQTFNDVVILASDVSLTTALGNVQFGSTLDSDSTARALTIDAQSKTSGTGTITFGGIVGSTKLGAVDITGNAVTVNQAFSSASTVQISNSGLLTVADDATITADGGFTQNGAGLMSLGADITTSTLTNTGISIASALTLLDDGADGQLVALSTGSGAGNIQLASIVGGNGILNNSLTLISGAGTTTVSGAVTELNTLTVQETGATGAVRFRGDLSLTTGLTVQAGAYDLSVTGASNSIAGNTTFLNTGTLTLGDEATDRITFMDGLTATAPSKVTKHGTIETSGVAMVLGAVELFGATTLNTVNSPGANITIGTVSGTDDLIITAGTGTVTFQGTVTAATVDATAATINMVSGSITTSGTQLYSGAVVLGANTTLMGSLVTFAGTLDSSNNGATPAVSDERTLGLTGNAVFGGAVGGTYALGSLAVSGSSAINGGSITTSGTQTYSGGVMLGANTTINTTNSTVQFGSTVDSVGDARALTIAAGTGDINFLSAVGNNTALGAVSITSAGTLVASGSVTADSFTQVAGSVLSQFDGAVTLNNAFDFTGQALSLNAALNAGSVRVTNAGLATVAGDITALGGFTQDGTGLVGLGADITTTNSDISFLRGVTLSSAVSIDTGTGAGSVTLNEALNGNYSLVIQSGIATLGFGAGLQTPLQSLTVNGATTVSGGVSTAFDQTYGGATQLLSDVTFTGRNVTFDGPIDGLVNGGQALALNSAMSTQINGAVGQSTPLRALTTSTSGITTINTSLVATTGRQLYNNPLTFTAGTLASPLVLRSSAGDIDFASTVSAGTNSKSTTRSLSVQAQAGDVFVRDQIGVNLNGLAYNDYQGSTDVNPYALSIAAADIYLLADVTTFETQTYDGRVHIGSNDSNGTVRLLISMDPSITFNGTIDDTIARTHTLDVRAVTVDTALGETPRIRFGGDIGRTRQIFALRAFTGVQLPERGARVADINSSAGLRLGVISIEGDVSTLQNQTYVGGMIGIGTLRNATVSLSSETGIINMLARPGLSGGLVNGQRLRLVLGSSASLGGDLADLFAVANDVGAVDLIAGLRGAGALLDQSEQGQIGQSLENGGLLVEGPIQILFQPEVEIGNIQSLACGDTPAEVLLACGFKAI